MAGRSRWRRRWAFGNRRGRFGEKVRVEERDSELEVDYRDAYGEQRDSNGGGEEGEEEQRHRHGEQQRRAQQVRGIR